MYEVTQELPFCYGHRLLRYPGKCGRLHGHNGIARVTLRSTELDSQGMVADFDQIERSLRSFLDDQFDHRLLLHRSDPALPVLQAAGEVVVALEVNPTAENLARLVFDEARRQGFPVCRVEMVEMDGSVARYEA